MSPLQVLIKIITIGFSSVIATKLVNQQLIHRMVRQQGYQLETHKITTEDGYLLTLHRIPRPHHRPVLLMHGLMGSSEQWILAGENTALAFLLARKGYDVWMGNARGNYHSRKHHKWNPDFNFEYWKFSWHEIGYYDLPASIDYILNRTNRTKLHYVGHSQGTTSFFVMTSERPEYNRKVSVMIALAPVAFMGHLRQPVLKLLAPYGRNIVNFLDSLKIFELPPIPNYILRLFGSTLCKSTVFINEICANILFLISGYDSKQLNRTLVPSIMSTTPAGASTRQIFHYGQNIVTGLFRKYDYGSIGNILNYNAMVPPEYNIKNITCPVGLFVGYNDVLAVTEDVKKLSQQLPNVVKRYLVPFKKFNHLDFLWANDVVELLYKKVLELMAFY